MDFMTKKAFRKKIIFLGTYIIILCKISTNKKLKPGISCLMYQDESCDFTIDLSIYSKYWGISSVEMIMITSL